VSRPGVALALLVAVAGPLSAQERDEATAAVFSRYADRLAKIQVVETGSGAKSTLGTGFFVTPDGHLLTNYHVIAGAIHDADRYRIVWVDPAGRSRPALIGAIDVVRDLAVLETGLGTDRYFRLGSPAIPIGTRLYSLGHPKDLGLSIVEGTYNGELDHTLYPKIHFTGPLNSGMSGGPALTAGGEVVGVNAATEGNSVSFLVPITAGGALVREALSAPDSTDLVAEIGRQLIENQDRYLATLFQGADSSVSIGPFELPTQPAGFFRCWADADRAGDALYELVEHQCSTDDFIYLSPTQSSGIVSLEHRVLVSRGLNPLRFYSLYTSEFRRPVADPLEPADDVTGYRCRSGNVRQTGMLVRTVFCVRRYTKYAGLYDAELKAAVLGARDAGVVTRLKLSGVSFENAERLTRKYVERIRWQSR